MKQAMGLLHLNDRLLHIRYPLHLHKGKQCRPTTPKQNQIHQHLNRQQRPLRRRLRHQVFTKHIRHHIPLPPPPIPLHRTNRLLLRNPLRHRLRPHLRPNRRPNRNLHRTPLLIHLFSNLLLLDFHRNPHRRNPQYPPPLLRSTRLPSTPSQQNPHHPRV